MFPRLLIPLDGSPRADAVIPQVRPLLQRKDAELILLAAVDADSPESERQRIEAGRVLDGWGRKLAADGLRVRTLLRTGAAADAILDAAEKERASLIALASHGLGGQARWILGAVAEKVLRASAVPVLTLRSFGPSGAPAEPTAFRKILVALGSEATLDVLDPVAALAKPFGSLVQVLHVSEGREPDPQPWMARAVERLKQSGLHAEALLRKGDAAHEILETAREQGAELLALTSRSRLDGGRWAFGAAAERVLRHATTPLFLARLRSKDTARRRWQAAMTQGPARLV